MKPRIKIPQGAHIFGQFKKASKTIMSKIINHSAIRRYMKLIKRLR